MAEWINGLGLVLEGSNVVQPDSMTKTLQQLAVLAGKPCGAHTSQSGLDLAVEGIEEGLNDVNMHGPWIFMDEVSSTIPLIEDTIEYSVGLNVFSVQEVYLLDREDDDKQAGTLMHYPYQQAGYDLPDRRSSSGVPAWWMARNIYQNAVIEIGPRPTAEAVARWSLSVITRNRIQFPAKMSDSINAPKELMNALLNYGRYHVAIHRKPDSNLPSIFLSRYERSVQLLRTASEKHTQGHVRMTVARGYRR